MVTCALPASRASLPRRPRLASHPFSSGPRHPSLLSVPAVHHPAAMSSTLQSWALPRLQPLLPLPDENLIEVISYAASLPTVDAVSTHFKVAAPTRLACERWLTCAGLSWRVCRVTRLHFRFQCAAVPGAACDQHAVLIVRYSAHIWERRRWWKRRWWKRQR